MTQPVAEITAQTLAWIYVLLQLPSIGIVLWAFKLHNENISNLDSSGYFAAVIPLFGKKTAIGILLYTLATMVLVLVFSYADPIDEVALLTMTTVNACFLILIALASLFFVFLSKMSDDSLLDNVSTKQQLLLFVRTLPWVIIQVAACMALYLSHYLVRQDLGESSLTDTDTGAIAATVSVLVVLPLLGLVGYLIKVGKIQCPSFDKVLGF